MQKQINVIVERNEPNVFLVFQFEKILKLNLSSDNQDETKSFFQNLLKTVFDDFVGSQTEYILLLLDDESDLFHDVAKKYVSNLGNEIQSLYSTIRV